MSLSWKSKSTVSVTPALTPSRPAANTDNNKVATSDLLSEVSSASIAVNDTAVPVHSDTVPLADMLDTDDLPDLIVSDNKATDDLITPAGICSYLSLSATIICFIVAINFVILA